MASKQRKKTIKPAIATCSSHVPRNEDVRDVLVLAQERQVKENLDRLGVGRHDDEFRNAPVQGLGGLVGTLLRLLVIRRLLDEVQEGDGQVRVREREGFFGHV